MFLKEILDPMLGFRPGEAPLELTADKQQNRREALEPIAPGQFHIVPLIDLNLGQPNLAAQSKRQALQHGRQCAAGRAPVSPKIGDHRRGFGGFDNADLKTIDISIENKLRLGDVGQKRILVNVSFKV